VSASAWLFFNILSTAFLAFYSMIEMACVSFNKVRLHYYVSKKNKRAIWLQELIQDPAKLFGTTLIGVNMALVVGSECAREFYAALGLNPDLSPLTQVIFVLIFGELAPMFAARSHAERVGMRGAPLLYFSAKIMTPLLLCVKGITKLCQFFIGGKEDFANIYLSQDELQKILEEQEEFPSEGTGEEFNAIAANIFTVRKKTAKLIMTPIKDVPMLPSNATIAQMHNLLIKHDVDFVPIYHEQWNNVIGIALPRDMIRPPETRRVREYARQPWFVTENTSVTQILRQFRHNNQSVAVILDEKGLAVGIVELDDVIEEIFGKTNLHIKIRPQKLIERTFSADLTVGKFNEQFGVCLDERTDLTLADLMLEDLEHQPQVGDRVVHGPFELIVKETSLLEIKSITIKSKLS
jgi:magnesium and cobalt exporter, CNNM family